MGGQYNNPVNGDDSSWADPVNGDGADSILPENGDVFGGNHNISCK